MQKIFRSCIQKMSQVSKANKRPIVLSGPSGSGKSTLLNLLFKEYPNEFGFSVSHTTRQPREGEKEGVNYYFVNKEEFQKQIELKQFIEWAQFSGNYYGTSIEAVKKVSLLGKTCILDIDMQGVQQVKKTDLNAKYVFISPPSIEELERRLRARNTETEESLKKRLEASKAEIEYSKLEGSHDLVIVNDNLDDAYTKLKNFIFN